MTHTPWRSGIWRTALLCLALCTATLAADPPAPTTPDIDTQYQSVLAEMKHPTSTGILITEIEPDSPAGAAGLHAGDIVYHYAGAPVRDLDTLRKRVADQIASAMITPTLPNNNDPNSLAGPDTKVLLGIHRAGKDIILQIPRSPLGIRAIEVEAGAPVPLNPPPSPRGSLTLAWTELSRLRTADTPPDFYRTTDVTNAWTSWQRREFLAGADDISVEFDNHHVDPATGENPRLRSRQLPPPHRRLRPHPRLYPRHPRQNHPHPRRRPRPRHRRTPRHLAPHTGQTHLPHARHPRAPTDQPLPPDALPEPALPIVAAALPHDPNAALQLHLLSIQDFIPRPGYLLIARGPPPA